MMDFLFFNAANQPLFTRNDAEQAEWTVEQFSFFGLFPYHPDKVLERGQRIAFQDADGIWQAFEIRNCKIYEPDHYQEITAEHICVSELTDDHVSPKEWDNVPVGTALASILGGTLWSLGNVTATEISSGSASYGSAWQGVNTIISNWNVYITPRITIGPNGITGRYLDVAPAQGNWRGLRLSINSNIEQAGVTYDDTNLLTAMYGYGKTSTPEQPITPTSPEPQDLDPVTLTFAGVTWTETADHPAKPAGQAYLENPTAKALYGRNGRNRFGFYQNGDVTSPEKLLELTWVALKKDSEPIISIEGTLHDLKRLGYADQTIRLHDTAIVEILPAGVEVQREIIQMTVDLLNPLNTVVTIGAYIPNIIYINKETAEKAESGSKGRGGGGGGGRGQTDAEKEFSEFQTQISANQYQILLRAWQQNKNNEILRQAGLSIDANGVLVYADDNERNIGSKLKVESDRITQIVQAVGSNGEVTAASIVAAVNSAGSSVIISADHIELDGQTVASSLVGYNVNVAELTASNLEVLGGMTVDQSVTCDAVVANGITLDGADVSNAVDSIGPATASGGQITIPWRRLDGTAGTPINFNIAATQFYIDTLAAFRTALLDADWSGNHATLISATLDTTNKNLTIHSAIANVHLPGQPNATQYTIGLGNLDLTTPLTSYYDAAYAAGQAAAPIQPRRYVTYTTNGTRTVSPSDGYDAMAAVEVTVNVPPPAYSASGWGITSTAGGGTKVELYVDGNHFTHTFNNYP